MLQNDTLIMINTVRERQIVNIPHQHLHLLQVWGGECKYSRLITFHCISNLASHSVVITEKFPVKAVVYCLVYLSTAVADAGTVIHHWLQRLAAAKMPSTAANLHTVYC